MYVNMYVYIYGDAFIQPGSSKIIEIFLKTTYGISQDSVFLKERVHCFDQFIG